MLRTTPLVTSHIYHVFNRGVNKADIYFEDSDYVRFRKVLDYYQSIDKPLRPFSHFSQVANSDPVSEQPRKVSIFAYCLMPNHFHLLLKQFSDGGITWFMQHLSNSYSHYIHTKYKRTGPLFEGRFKNVLVESDEQFLHVLRYIHLNPLVSGLVNDLRKYNHSSYSVYIGLDTDNFCETKLGLSFFKTRKGFEKFVLDQANYGKALEKIKQLAIDLE